MPEEGGSHVANDEQQRALRAEAFDWAAFWERSCVKDLQLGESMILTQLLRYYNAGALTDEELAELGQQAGVTLTLNEETLHRQTRVQHGDDAADVDEDIAPLILELWRAGLRTAAWPLTSRTPERGSAGLQRLGEGVVEQVANMRGFLLFK